MNAPAVVAGRGWLRRFEPDPSARIRLLCLPHAGGAAGFFRPWAASVPPGVEVVGVQYPGRQDRTHDAHPERMDALVAELVDALEELLDRPFALVGHSMGAAVAYETARALEQRGIPPRALFVSGRPPAHRCRRSEVHRGGDEALVADLRRLGGIDQDLLEQPALLELALPALRADYRLVETYEEHPGPPLRCPVVALVGEDDPEVDRDEATAWQERTRGSFRLRQFPGGHFYLVHRRGEVIEEILRCLNQPAAVHGRWPSTP